MGMIANKMLFEWINRKLLSHSDINESVALCRKTPNAALIDVREADEYASGHIPGAINVPLSVIKQISLPKEIPLFVYCLRGSRSKKAVDILNQMGYQDVRSIGGINRYKGNIE